MSNYALVVLYSNIFFVLIYFETSKCISIDFTNDILFLLYTKNLQKYPQQLYINDSETLTLSDFKSGRKSVVLIHDWGTGQRSIHITPIKNAFIESQNVNIIIIDWQNEAMLSYISAKKLINQIGEYITKFLQFLINTAHAKQSDFHLIGYGMGAHIAGNTAIKLPFINRITALNPETKLFSKKDFNALKSTERKCTQIFISKGNEYLKNYLNSVEQTSFWIMKNETFNKELNLGEYYGQLISRSLKIQAVRSDELKRYLNIDYVDISENLTFCIPGQYFVTLN